MDEGKGYPVDLNVCSTRNFDQSVSNDQAIVGTIIHYQQFDQSQKEIPVSSVVRCWLLVMGYCSSMINSTNETVNGFKTSHYKMILFELYDSV